MNYRIFLFIIVSFIFKGCIDLRPCAKSIEGKYYCDRNDKAINFLEIRDDGTFLHYYKEKDIELFHNGTWKRNSDGYCLIELNEWKNYNQEGKNYREFGNGILFINGDYLDISPDGESSSSFKKK